MLAQHFTPYKSLHTHYLISADPTAIPVWEQTPGSNLSRPRVTFFVFYVSISPNSGRMLWNKTYAFMQMAVPICDANWSRENLVPFASCEPSQTTNSPGVFLVRLTAQHSRDPSKWTQLRYVDLKKGGEKPFPYHRPLKATPCPLEKLVTMTDFH